ncbi:hypothetical protein [Flagellimonas profundi]|uniref:Uncharacterized protein n=1 Tax=Flagellimonas profundi TaxID=2915620 RepID=A0ABS3FAJ5_9FLAO|nr:hypothetical protein [Allomuricauda profundi]MBO0340122.1 hypothetical protein [Allomuricauda profundi]
MNRERRTPCAETALQTQENDTQGAFQDDHCKAMQNIVGLSPGAVLQAKGREGNEPEAHARD